jgi:hypothetical protein
MRERTVEGYLKDRVKATGGMIRKAQWIAHRGCPDRWCGWPSTKKRGWVETKKPTTPHAEAHQAREHARLRACGERVDLIATLEQVDAYIKEMTS